MGGLFGSAPKVIPEFTGLQVNTAVQTLPVPIIYGAPRVPINMIYFNGFKSVLQSQSSGKGLLSGGKGAKQVEYFATVLMAVGEGPVSYPLVIYQNQEVWTPATYPSNGAYYFNGLATQAPWSYIESTWPNDARPYKNTAYYAFLNAQLDASATMPQINLVVNGFFAGTSPLNYSTLTITSGQYDPNGHPLSFIGNITLGTCDADPGQCIYDFLTNPTYGATFPAEWIDATTLLTQPNGYDPNTGDSAISTFCQAVGLAWSVALNNVESAGSILDRWCKNLNTAIVWNGAVLRFVPYWDSYASANPGWAASAGVPLKYFTPYTVPVVSIPLDQILQSESNKEDPITFARKNPWDVFNTVRLDFTDRTNFFNSNPVEAKDEALAELYGPRVDNISGGNEFTLQTYANMSVQMQLRRNVAIRRTYTWKLGPLWGWLDPMDVVEIPNPTNYNNTVLVRIISAEDDEDENSTIVAEEFPVGSQSPTIIPMAPTTPPNQGATNAPPSNVYPPLMFTPPTAMLTATGFAAPQWIFGAAAGFDGGFDTNWGGANVWVSLDDVSYELAGTLYGPSTIGALTQTLPGYSGGAPDNVDTLYVNLSECGGALGSVTPAAAATGNTICCLSDVSGFEILGYTTATLIGNGVYALTGLYRGLYGTTSRLFGAGSQFMLVAPRANFLEVPLQPAYVGKEFFVKAQSFNIFNTAEQDLNTVVAWTTTLLGPTPEPPTPPPSVPQRRPRAPTSAQPPGMGRVRRT